MKMSRYYLVQDSEKNFPISPDGNVSWVRSCCILGFCDSENKDDD